MAAPLPRFLDLGDQRLEYAWHGPRPEEAPTLVFLHEGLGCVELWKDVPARLAAETGLGALVYTRAGYGRSSPITLPRGPDYLKPESLDVLPRVLDAAGVRRAVLVGHSDGGSIALMAAGGRDDPRIAGVVTEAAHVFIEDVTLAGIREARVAWDQGPLRQRLARYHFDNTETAFFGWNDTWQTPEYRSWNIEDMLPGVTVPSLIMQGVEDQYGTEAQVDAIVSQVSGPTRKLMIPDCAHVPHFEQKDRVVAEISAFARQVL